MSKKTILNYQRIEGSEEWLTPPEIIKKLGEFDLDPCSPVNRPWSTALNHFTILDDGLSKEWIGRVWLNPPYGDKAKYWLKKLSEHNDGIALIFARTETKMFFNYVWNKANAIFFIKGRLKFLRIDGTVSDNFAGSSSVLVAYGKNNSKILQNIDMPGKYIKLK